jgi:hypothetical protein
MRGTVVGHSVPAHRAARYSAMPPRVTVRTYVRACARVRVRVCVCVRVCACVCVGACVRYLCVTVCVPVEFFPSITFHAVGSARDTTRELFGGRFRGRDARTMADGDGDGDAGVFSSGTVTVPLSRSADRRRDATVTRWQSRGHHIVAGGGV